MKWSVGSKIGTLLAVTWLLLLVVGVAAYRTVNQMTSTAGWSTHTMQVRLALSELTLQILNAETGERGFIITGDERYLQSYTSGVAGTKSDLARIRQLTADNAGQQRRLDMADGIVKQCLDDLDARIALRRDKGFDAARQTLIGDRDKRAMDDIRERIGEMDKEEGDLQVTRDAAAAASAEGMKQLIIGGTIVVLVYLLVAGFVLSASIAKPLGAIASAADQIAAGNTVVNLPHTDRTDEVGALTNAFGRMIQSLQAVARVASRVSEGDLTVEVKPLSELDTVGTALSKMVKTLREMNRETREAAGVLSSATSQILSATSQLSAGAAETATAVSQTTTTLEEVKQAAQLSSQKARNVADTAQKSAQISQAGRKSVDETIHGMERIREQMDLIAEGVVRLSEQSQAIGELIASVNDLAEQSNLLAVNAAIEAAKAGDQGKGFAVVAQEVRSLAEQSKQATAQVRAILGDVQKATSAAVMATEQGSKAVESGSKQSVESGESIRALTDSITESTQAVTQIAASSQQQLVGVDQVAMAMESIKQASLQNAQSAKQTESTARSLHELGGKLRQMVEQYQV